MLFFLHLFILDGEADEIIKEIQEHTMKIGECYDRLRKLGVVVVEKAVSENADGRVQRRGGRTMKTFFVFIEHHELLTQIIVSVVTSIAVTLWILS